MHSSFDILHSCDSATIHFVISAVTHVTADFSTTAECDIMSVVQRKCSVVQ